MAYPHQKIEQQWQLFWEQHKTFSVKNNDTDSQHKTFYALDMFPYPSGAGLHVGHPEGYTATDIICRKKRMEGYKVLHPMGWDAFGLPAENFAIKTGVHPQKSTQQNIKNFTRQIKSLGFSYDWDREINTTDPKYYKWTQDLFVKFYEKGLLYEDEKPMNWCPHCKVVVANEEVENGLHERCQNPVTKKSLKQWMFRITDYAERLLKDLEDPLLDWPEKIKAMQRNWIGKSTGLLFTAPLLIEKSHNQALQEIQTYSTHFEAFYADRFVVIAPDHPLLSQLIEGVKNRKEIEQKCEEIITTRNARGFEEEKESEGIFTGRYINDPVSGEVLPIWVASFALADYGTGIVKCSCHDERDFRFAKKYNISMHPVLFPEDPEEAEKVRQLEYCYSDMEKGVLHEPKEFAGQQSGSLREKIIEYAKTKGFAKVQTNYRLRDWIFTRQRYWGEPIPLVFDENGKCYPLDESELPVLLPESANYEPCETGESPLAKIDEWVNVQGYVTEEGKVRLISSSEKNDPVLSKERKLQKFRRETSTMPNWAGSSWYWLRYMDANNTNQAWLPQAEKEWGPVDLYVGGAEHAVLHLLYARFWHKALYDMGLVSSKEPFKKLVNQGLILSHAYQNKNGGLVPIDEVEEQSQNGETIYIKKDTGEQVEKIIAKMSKSLKNVVNPDDIIKAYGADTLRMYEMFMGPFEQNKAWDTGAVEGMYKFLSRIYRYFIEHDIVDTCPSQELIQLTHQTVKKVSNDIDEFKFNTALSQLMVWMNSFSKLNVIPRVAGGKFIRLLSPFAPHLAEELWKRFKPDSKTIAFEAWPSYDPKLLVQNTITYAVQINGKIRGDFSIAKDSSKEECISTAKKLEKVQKYLQNGNIKKEIFVPGKIIGFVVQ